MIDTDKYEGHTKGPWKWGKQGSTDNGDGTIMIRPFTQLESKSGVTLLAIHHGDAKQSDLKLMAATPDLLAEVKRLQKAYEVMGEALRENGSDYCEHCLKVYWDATDEVLYRHREGRCLT